MNQTAAISPVPWKTQAIKGRYETHISYSDPCTTLVATTLGLHHAINAERIVRAVNCHDELLAALKAAEAEIVQLVDWVSDYRSDLGHSPAKEPDSMPAIRAAIAKAEGRS